MAEQQQNPAGEPGHAQGGAQSGPESGAQAETGSGQPDARGAERQGDGADPGGEVGRVGSSDRAGEGGYGNDTGFATGTTGSREGMSPGGASPAEGGER
jgi:hypothetical protein